MLCSKPERCHYGSYTGGTVGEKSKGLGDLCVRKERWARTHTCGENRPRRSQVDAYNLDDLAEKGKNVAPPKTRLSSVFIENVFSSRKAWPLGGVKQEGVKREIVLEDTSVKLDKKDFLTSQFPVATKPTLRLLHTDDTQKLFDI